MAKVIKQGKTNFWIDGEGRQIPEQYIDRGAKRRDKLVSNLVNRARRLQAIIAAEKELMSIQIADYLTTIADDKGVAWQGSTTLWNFSMDEAIMVKVAKRLTFDENLNLAKRKIDACIKNWSPGSSDKIVTLVNRAFDVDADGQVDARQILSLRQYKFDDAEWITAMNLIADSVKVQSTKTYYYFQEAGPDGKLNTITLDFAAL